jgi:nitrile hydratase accessory protein
MNASPDLKSLLASLPGDGEGPCFTAPWQARIFALVVALAEQGRFPWSEFQRRLIEEVAREGDDPEHYYECWLAAAERLVREFPLISSPLEGEVRVGGGPLTR